MALEQIIARLVGVLSVKTDKKSMTDAQKQMQTFNEGLIQLAKGLTLGVGGAAALTYTMNSLREYGQNLQNNALSLGMSTEALEKWNHVAQAVGLTGDQIIQTFQALEKTQGQAALGGTEQATAYARLGVQIRNADDSLKSQEQLLFEVADALKGVTDEALRARLAEQVLTKAGAAMLPALLHGSKAIRDTMAEMDELSSSQAFLQASRDWTAALARMFASFRKLGTVVAQRIIPAFTRMTDALADGVKWFAKLLDTTKIIETAMIGLDIVIAALAANGVVNLVKLFSAFNPITKTAALITAALMGLFLIAEDFLVYKAGGESVLGHIVEAFDELWKKLSEGDTAFADNPMLKALETIAQAINVIDEAWANLIAKTNTLAPGSGTGLSLGTNAGAYGLPGIGPMLAYADFVKAWQPADQRAAATPQTGGAMQAPQINVFVQEVSEVAGAVQKEINKVYQTVRDGWSSGVPATGAQ